MNENMMVNNKQFMGNFSNVQIFAIGIATGISAAAAICGTVKGVQYLVHRHAEKALEANMEKELEEVLPSKELN